MTTKFQSSLDKLKAKIAKEGVRVDYIVEEPHLIGQGVNIDDRVETRFLIDVLFTDETQGRDGGDVTPSNSATCIMAGDSPVEPKAGDKLITPLGKMYPVNSVRRLMPDGIPLRYTLSLEDG